jgi:hypothetical protein
MTVAQQCTVLFCCCWMSPVDARLGATISELDFHERRAFSPKLHSLCDLFRTNSLCCFISHPKVKLSLHSYD